MTLISKFLPRFLQRGRTSDKSKSFDESKHAPNFKILLLDDSEISVYIKASSKGLVILNHVYEHLNLEEKDYYGLRFLDDTHQTQWLDASKSVASQFKAMPPFTLYFGIKFYSADPCKLNEEITRYQFFLQVKRDILQGRLPLAYELATELSALAVQSELGDFDPKRHSPGYVSEFRFVPNQTEDYEARVTDLHRGLRGTVPAAAEYRYLDKVKWLDMYGVDLHPVLGEGSVDYFLGLTPTGVVVYRNKNKVGNYFWPRLTKITHKNKLFIVKVRDKNNVDNTYAFECTSKQACKHLWKCCIQHHAFFRLTSASGSYRAAGKLLGLGSKNRYSGKSDRQRHSSGSSNREPPQVVRTPSKRYSRRHSVEALHTVGLEGDLTDAESMHHSQSQRVISGHKYSRERGYQSAPDSPKKSAPWETSARGNGGLYTTGKASPVSVRSEKMMFPRRINSGSESEGGAKSRYHKSRLDPSDTESEYYRHRRSRRPPESASESEVAYNRHKQKKQHRSRKSTDSLPAIGTSGPFPLRQNGSVTSMVSESAAAQQRRRRKRSKSPGNKPPEELAQFFKYIDPAEEGITEDQMKDIAFTNVETIAHAPRVPRNRHRNRSLQRLSCGDLNGQGVSRTPSGHCEAPPPYTSPYPPQQDFGMRSPASVQHNPSFAAPIIKTKPVFNDSALLADQRTSALASNPPPLPPPPALSHHHQYHPPQPLVGNSPGTAADNASLPIPASQAHPKYMHNDHMREDSGLGTEDHVSNTATTPISPEVSSDQFTSYTNPNSQQRHYYQPVYTLPNSSPPRPTPSQRYHGLSPAPPSVPKRTHSLLPTGPKAPYYPSTSQGRYPPRNSGYFSDGACIQSHSEKVTEL